MTFFFGFLDKDMYQKRWLIDHLLCYLLSFKAS